MKKSKFISLVLAVTLSTSAIAEIKNADDLIKTMKKENITYAQLMDGMAMAINNIQEGIIAMNEMLVYRGIDFIRTHPAPKQKPWVIMDEKDRDAFKSTLVAFDKQMDEDVLAIEKAVKDRNWGKALQDLNNFQNTCMSCHQAWKSEVKYIMK